MEWKVYFDMDGVLADFQKGVLDLCHMEPTPLNGKRDVHYDDRMWAAIREIDHFYSKLEFMPGAKELFDAVYDRLGARCEILTAIPKPTRGIVYAQEDKIAWVRQKLSDSIKINIVTREDKPKFCSGKECVLIDDMPKSIKTWEMLGGTGIVHTTADETLKKLHALDIL